MYLLEGTVENVNNVVPGNASNGFCQETASLWQFVGIILLIIKIVIPIVLIILGMIDLGKAVISSDEKQISKSAKSLLMRLIAAVVIFFVPTIISAVFSLLGAFNEEVKADYDICETCIEHPNKTGDGSCKSYIK